MGSLPRPCCAEILQTVEPGEVAYLWQMRVEESWTILPTLIRRALDREYATWVCRGTKQLKPMCSAGFHLRFNQEMKVQHLLEKTRLDADGSRHLPSDSKHWLIMNFHRERLEIRLDTDDWRKIRCVKLTHEEAGQVVNAPQLQSILTSRMEALAPPF